MPAASAADSVPETEAQVDSMCTAAYTASIALCLYRHTLPLLREPATCVALGASAVYRLVAASTVPLQSVASLSVSITAQSSSNPSTGMPWLLPAVTLNALIVLNEVLEIATAGGGRQYAAALKSTLCRPEKLREQLEAVVPLWSAWEREGAPAALCVPHAIQMQRHSGRRSCKPCLPCLAGVVFCAKHEVSARQWEELGDMFRLLHDPYDIGKMAVALPPRGSPAALQLQQLAGARVQVLALERPPSGAGQEQLAACVNQLSTVASCGRSLSLQQPDGEAILAALVDAFTFVMRQPRQGGLEPANINYMLFLAASAAKDVFAAGEGGGGAAAPGGLLSSRQLLLCVEAAGVVIGAALAVAEQGCTEVLLISVQTVTGALAGVVEQLKDGPSSRSSLPSEHGATASALGTAEAALRLAALLAAQVPALPADSDDFGTHVDCFQECLRLAYSLLAQLGAAAWRLEPAAAQGAAAPREGACVLGSARKLALVLAALPAEVHMAMFPTAAGQQRIMLARIMNLATWLALPFHVPVDTRCKGRFGWGVSLVGALLATCLLVFTPGNGLS